MTDRTPRGIRNHNPGNLERVPGVRWRGQARAQTDPRFIVFDAPVWGIRAMARVLLTYYRRRGLRTVRQIVARWAPPSENLTGEYAADIARRLGVGIDAALELTAPLLERLCAALVRHENGLDPYPASLYRDAVRLAWGEPT